MTEGKPRVVMVSANAYPVMGGVETHIYEVAPRLAADGFDVTILTTDRSGDLSPTDEMRGVPVRRVPAWPKTRDYYWAPRVPRMIREERWDIVHCQGYHTLVAPLAMIAARRERIPYFVTFHSGGHDSRIRLGTRGIQHLLLRPLLARAARLIAVSRWEANHFARELRFSPARFATIPNGVRLNELDGTSADDPLRGDSHGGHLIVSVGRLEKYKGHQRVLAAMPHLVKMLPDVRLRICGSGTYEDKLRRMARESGVGDRIEISGVDPADRTGMANLVGSAAAVVLMSEYESHGIAALEALALGRRLIVADTTALREFADQGVARAVALDSSPEDLAREIRDYIAAPPPPRVEMQTWDQCATALAGLYSEVLAA